MNTDFRIKVGYFQHPKTKKLINRLGHVAVVAHMQLFEFTATSKPDGVLSNMNAEDIMLAADYKGDGDFVAVLLDLRFLDLVDGVYYVHDWIEHNPWASGASKRSVAGKKGAEARWGKTAPEDGSNDNGIRESCEPQSGSQCDANATAMQSHATGNAPFLSFPSPILSNSKEEESPQPPTEPHVAAPLVVDEDDLNSLEEHAPPTKAERAAIAESAKNASALFIDGFRSVNDGADPDIPPRYHKQLGLKLKDHGREKFVLALQGFFASSWAHSEGFNVATFVSQPLDRWTGPRKGKGQRDDGLMPLAEAQQIYKSLTRPYIPRQETAH